MFQSHEGRGGDGAQSRTTCPSRRTTLNFPDDAVGPGPRFSQHFASRGWEEIFLLL
jgi:hypothetical protein